MLSNLKFWWFKWLLCDEFKFNCLCKGSFGKEGQGFWLRFGTMSRCKSWWAINEPLSCKLKEETAE